MLREESSLPLPSAAGFEASHYREIVTICHRFWQVEPKIQFLQDAQRMSKQRKASAGRLQESCCFFT